MCQAITVEKQRREKLVTEQTLKVLKKIPYRASFYLFLINFSSKSFIFVRRKRDMQKILSEMESG